MSGSIVRRLILKDLYLVRWMVAGSIVSGGVALALLPLSSVSAYVGGVSLICVLITLNIFLVMGVAQERKDKVMLFVLSLPVSTTEYLLAKVAANAIAFVVPWLALTAAAVALIYGSQIPDGILPFWVTVLAYLLSYFCTLLAVALVSDSTGWHTTAIIVGNVSVNFLIPFLLGLPSVVAHIKSPTAVWTADIIAILMIEIAVGVAALGFAVYFRSRNPDFV